ncbi:MAG: peptidoglycan DD-metalloendopeptidase family protein [Porticoccaceae bacterium]|nr:peptidoglycan DD-metalloendopeptidase family protein [Porticoccaceae bacterium]MDG1306545.1 peptidoglycan DD-metalloendopeptidase family protein [Porticoccaceae bacterium]
MIRLWAVSVLAIGLMLPLSSNSVADDKQQARLDDLKRSISKLEKRLSVQDKEKNSLQSELKKVELETSQISRNLRSLRKKVAGLEVKLASLGKQEIELQAEIAQQSGAIVDQISSAYKLGSEEPIKLLLNQEDPQKIARVLRYYGYFLEARTKKIQRYIADVDALADVVEDISKEKLSLTKSRTELERGQRKLRDRVKKRSGTLAKLKTSLVTDKKKLGGLQKERGELEEILSAVEEAVADMTLPKNYQSFASRKGKLKWPLKGTVAHSFGSTRSGELRWEGWLISAKAGAAVNAVHNGRVVFSNYLRGFGLLIILDHGDGYMTLYAHNQELLKDTGDWVQSSQTLARAGDTGGLSKPALYFEIRKQGKPSDPKSWLGKR